MVKGTVASRRLFQSERIKTQEKQHNVIKKATTTIACTFPMLYNGKNAKQETHGRAHVEETSRYKDVLDGRKPNALQERQDRQAPLPFFVCQLFETIRRDAVLG